MTGRIVELEASEPGATAYLSTPPGGGPGVLVLHAWWGLNETACGVCDRLAAAGFVALAPDFYQGRLATTIPEAETLSDELPSTLARAYVDAAINRLLAETGAEQIGAVGFSLGGSMALSASARRAEIAAVVMFYATNDVDLSGSRATYLGHFAESDEFEPTEGVDALEASIRSAGRDVTFHRYPATGHWFFEPDRPDAFNQAAADLAWERTIGFLAERLRGG